MCGICGVVSADRRGVEPAVRAMMRAMVHRGPDDEGYQELPLGADEAGPVAGLGFRRLSILDLSPSGHQPMVCPQTGNWLVFNGEIYNFRSLRSNLESRGIVFTSTGDTEVLLKALSVWGEQAMEFVDGMYAFAFYEAKSRRILLARDPLGIKPLYYAHLHDRFVFASEVRAVLASGLVPQDLDVAGIAGMLAYGAVQSPRTVFQHIRSFPAASAQWIDATVAHGRLPSRPTRHWGFPKQTIDDDRDTAAAMVRRLLRGAVLRHLVADVPVGVFLSAGIDSTIVATIAREYTPQVTAFTVGFGRVHGEDEVSIASETARLLGIKHVAVEIDAQMLSYKWHDWLAAMDSPSVDGFNTYAVSRRLAREGVVVGLSGLGADEIFGGYNTFNRAVEWSRRLQSLSFMPQWLRSTAITGFGLASGRTGAVEKLADLVNGDASVSGVAMSLRRALSNKRIEALGLAAARVGLGRDYLDAIDLRGEIEFDGDDFNTVSRIETSHYMRDTLLRDTDANSMRNSLEVRVPFLDRTVVEYVSSLRGVVKNDGSVPSKALLRQAFAPDLSVAVTNRPKTGFMLPIGDWMRSQMRESCEEAIGRLEGLGVLDENEVRRTWRTFQRDGRSIHWSRPLALVVLGSYLSMCSSNSEPVACAG